ncbi:MAG: response regulator [Balneola sp.]|nr:response regulator [Balneola sp.]|tara:strand:+ start:25087 stop:25455 length:369 start_codon:yes stop_codon:yes gene_type:complete
MKILIVEDDKVLSLLLSKMIERLGYEIIDVVTKGRDAIEQIEKTSPDLVLMDIMLEDDIDGIDAMIAIRKKDITVPVIFITGNSDPYHQERAKVTDYEEYLIKPVGFDDLKKNIASVEQKKS